MIENASNIIVLDELSDEAQIFLYYITEDVGRILIVCPENAVPTITDFGVSYEYRNKGIGKALLLRGVEELIRRQPEVRSLQVKPRALDPEKISQEALLVIYNKLKVDLEDLYSQISLEILL